MWELADSAGVRLGELTTAAGKTLSYTRNGVAEASYVVSHEDDSAALLLDALAVGIPSLKIWRYSPSTVDQAAGGAGVYQPGRLVFNGYLAPFSEGSEETSLLTAVFRSPFGRLLGDGPNRGRFTDLSVTFAAIDAGQIAKSLIDTTNVDSFTGLATSGGTIAATMARDRTYQSGNVGELIVNLTNVIDGFDFEERFVDGGTTKALFNVYASLDESRPLARFEYGADTISNVRSMGRMTQAPINDVTVLGANGLFGHDEDAGSKTAYGWWPAQISASDVTEQSTLDDKASALLRPGPIKTVTFTPEYALESCPQPWDDFWIGSEVPFFARRGALFEDVSVRINAAKVVVDENGFEATEIDNPLTPGDEAAIKASLSVEVVGG